MFCFQNYFTLSSSMDKTVRLWHVSQKECLCCFQHIDFVTAISFHPKARRCCRIDLCMLSGANVCLFVVREKERFFVSTPGILEAQCNGRFEAKPDSCVTTIRCSGACRSNKLVCVTPWNGMKWIRTKPSTNTYLFFHRIIQYPCIVPLDAACLAFLE